MISGLTKNARNLTLLCAAVYFCSYVSRINYAAVLVEMVAQEGFTRSAASTALTGLFITYGAGQLVSGYLGDKIKPQLLICAGLLCSAIMNVLIPLCQNTAEMTVVWCVNGLAQAMMWPPLVKIMASLLSPEEYKKATVRVSWGSSLGTIFVYLAAPACIRAGGWRLVFYFSAATALLMAALWLLFYSKLEKGMQKKSVLLSSGKKLGKGGLPAALLPLLGSIMLAIVLQGILRDGITTWMPSYVSDTFHTENAVAILTSVALPIFSILAFQAAEMLNRKWIPNEMACACVIFFTGFLALVVLRVLGTRSLAATVFTMALAVGCMHGANLILICMVPAYFQRFGRTSLISGMLNSCTYVGSALSTYGVAAITDRCGWNLTASVWCLVALGGAICCAFCVHAWRRFKQEKV